MKLNSLTSQLTNHDNNYNLEQSSHDLIKELEAKITTLEENLVMASQRLENMDERLGKLSVNI